ncbi:hypothetical protein E4U42_000162 [Claviceps africana]|uniref:Cytochrome P450 n=1 Tax=Claviceps africana TaxID=83212 RepID=A0A8K0JA71_9HYPO|nr:hypothetical protein E4U42_000162 [Claviceps africana]
MIQRQSKSLSFRPFLQVTARKFGDASDVTYEIFGGDMPERLSRAVRSLLLPGQHLDEQNLRMGNRVLVELNNLMANINMSRPRSINLLEWTRHLVVQASSCGVYGNYHPLLNPKVEQAFWKWQEYLPMHLAGFDPLGKGYQHRQVVYDAYIEYCRNLPEDGSELARVHKRIMQDSGVDELDYAKQASLFTFAVFANTSVTLYWTIWELFSRPSVLSEVRKELETHAIQRTEDRTGEFTLDLAALKSKCPILLSVFQETQRTRHVNASFRKVMTDTVLDDKYLLKAGNFLQLPGHPVHCDTSLWGPDAREFNPYRFVPTRKKQVETLQPNSFVAWGLPPFLCPARQFAAAEILIATALLAIRADLLPRCGKWDPSPALNYTESSTLLNPEKDLRVDVRSREMWTGTWSLRMGESIGRIPLVSG